VHGDFARGQFSRHFIFAFSLHFLVLVQRNDINSYYEYSHRNGGWFCRSLTDTRFLVLLFLESRIPSCE